MTAGKTAWYLTGADGKATGPFPAEEVLRQLREGQINKKTMCCQKGAKAWLALGEIETFAAEIRQARAPARRRLVAVLASVAAALLLGGGGVAAYFVMREPPALRDAKVLLVKSEYSEAADILAMYLASHPQSAEGNYLLALCSVSRFAFSTSDFGLPKDDPSQGLQDAKESLKRALARDGKLKERAAADLAAIFARMPVQSRATATRAHAVALLQFDLGLADGPALAKEIVDKLQGVPLASALDEPVIALLKQAIKWDPSLAESAVALVLAPAGCTPQQFGYGLRRIYQLMSDEVGLGNALAPGILKRADQHAAEGQYDEAEELWSIARRTKPDPAAEIAAARLSYLKKRVASDPAGAVAQLDRTSQESPEMKAGAPALYLEAARRLKATDPARAKRALEMAQQVNPQGGKNEDFAWQVIQQTANPDDAKIAKGKAFLKDFPASSHREQAAAMIEAVAWQIIEQTAQPDDNKLARCKAFLADYPASARRAQGLTMLLDDAVQCIDGGSWSANAYIAAANANVAELLAKFAATPNVDRKVLEFAKRLAAKGQHRQALDLSKMLVTAIPNTPLKTQIEVVQAEWRGKLGLVLPPDLQDLSDRADKELRILDFTVPGAIRALASKPESYHILRVADDCTSNKFSSDEKDLLRKWVSDGGILWVNNDVLSFFDIKYVSVRRGNEVCAPAVTPQICPILTGCKWVRVGHDNAHDLSHRNVVPLLAVAGGGTRVSLVPYGKGWVTNMKWVDSAEYDGARFWLNFRLAVLGWPIPDSPRKDWTLKRLPGEEGGDAALARPDKPAEKAPLSGTWQTSTGAMLHLTEDGAKVTIELVKSTPALRKLAGTLTSEGKKSDEPAGTLSAVFVANPQAQTIHASVVVHDRDHLTLRFADWPVFGKNGKKVDHRRNEEELTRSPSR
jgi:outer membrane protein assembly factor BamD (BamD/ComL family)